MIDSHALKLECFPLIPMSRSYRENFACLRGKFCLLRFTLLRRTLYIEIENTGDDRGEDQVNNSINLSKEKI